jgi:hypothetical protein
MNPRGIESPAVFSGMVARHSLGVGRGPESNDNCMSCQAQEV